MSAPTLTEFLLARIAEDEARFDALAYPGDDVWGKGWEADTIRGLAYRLDVECGAKRRIVTDHECRAWPEDGQPEEVCERCGQAWPCVTMAALASIYVDHPDYDRSWTL